jgi:hypothetical protein
MIMDGMKKRVRNSGVSPECKTHSRQGKDFMLLKKVKEVLELVS